jgi:hypothetical protein
MTRHRPRALAVPAVVILGVLVTAGPVRAHGPDPVLGGTRWTQNQVLPYQWKSGQVPPSWLAAAIDAAAADANRSRASQAAMFTRPGGSAASTIAYGEPTGCSSAGIACFDRSNAPYMFRMWFRAQGYVFDWGTLRWCEGLTTLVNGCFDAETIALDEFGHVELLNHHVNRADLSDYLDAVVQATSRARPATGWQVHAFGRCDVARLQLEYDRPTPRDPFSSCLAIPTSTTISASSTNIWIGDTMQFTVTLRTTSSSANRSLANDPVSARTITLQRRPIGSTSWLSLWTMASSPTIEGTYVLSVSPSLTYDWRAVFTPAAGDGALSSTSPIVRVTVGGCSVPGCPG